jgi:hypothetical protein
MFRHTTKQSSRSQEKLRKGATAALDKDRQILCESVYDNTYCAPLPGTSIDMLNNIVMPLTGCQSEVGGKTRLLYTVAKFDGEEGCGLRVSFIQPEVSSATAVTSPTYSTILNGARSGLMERLNNAAPGRISVSKEKCQVAGRISPYVVEEAGLAANVEWSYFNASKSRIFYVFSSVGGAELMSMTKETISIYQAFAVKDCAIVYASDMRCFKVTAAPEDTDEDECPNKSTSIFLYCDGTFKVLGTPRKSYKVCSLLRETIIRAHTSSMSARILRSLGPLEDPGSQLKS